MESVTGDLGADQTQAHTHVSRNQLCFSVVSWLSKRQPGGFVVRLGMLSWVAIDSRKHS